MKRSIIVLALAAAMTASAGVTTRLLVWNTDGDKVAYEMNKKPSLQFEGDNVAITIGADRVEMPLNQLSHFTYDTIITTGVDEVEADATSPAVTDGSLVFSLREGENIVDITSLAGVRVFHSTIDGSESEHVVSLASLQPGVYVVTFNGFTYKIVKK